MTYEQLVARVRGYAPLLLPAGSAHRAAVLVLFRAGPAGELELVLTRRCDELEDHSGQVAFAGGHVDSGDAGPEATAVREAEEELGIPITAVEVLGRLDDFVSITGYHIVPVVGWLRVPVVLRPNPREVARAFAVPLAELLREERWEQRPHRWRGPAARGRVCGPGVPPAGNRTSR